MCPRPGCLRRGKRPGKPLTFRGVVSGGVGMEVGRAALDLAAGEFVGVLVRLAVVGQQRPVEGEPRAAAAPLGQAGAQRPVAAPFQAVAFGQIGQQGLAAGLGRGSPAQAEGGREQGGQPRTGGEGAGKPSRGRTGAAVVGPGQVGEQPVGGVGGNGGRGEDILPGAPAPGRG